MSTDWWQPNGHHTWKSSHPVSTVACNYEKSGGSFTSRIVFLLRCKWGKSGCCHWAGPAPVASWRNNTKSALTRSVEGRRYHGRFSGTIRPPYAQLSLWDWRAWEQAASMHDQVRVVRRLSGTDEERGYSSEEEKNLIRSDSRQMKNQEPRVKETARILSAAIYEHEHRCHYSRRVSRMIICLKFIFIIV